MSSTCSRYLLVTIICSLHALTIYYVRFTIDWSLLSADYMLTYCSLFLEVPEDGDTVLVSGLSSSQALRASRGGELAAVVPSLDGVELRCSETSEKSLRSESCKSTKWASLRRGSAGHLLQTVKAVS